MMTNPVGSLTANNAAFNMMSASNSLISFAGNRSMTPGMLLAAEKRLTASMIDSGVAYKAGLLMQETADKLAKDNIKRTFSVFA